jgi:hypothetical protein
MLVAIGDSMSGFASSDPGENGEEEVNEETEWGQLSEDDEPGWMPDTITKTIQQRKEGHWDDVCNIYFGSEAIRQPPRHSVSPRQCS